MKKIVFIIFLLTIGCSKQVLNLRSDKPVTEPNTGILFPSDLCGLSKIEMKTFPQKELGVSFSYQYADLNLTFYVYNAGLSSIEDGVESEVIEAQYMQSIDAIYALLKMGKYSNVSEVRQNKMDLQIKSQKLKALFAHFDLTQGDFERGSFLMITGYKNQIFKVRYTFPKKLEKMATTKWEYILKTFADDKSETVEENGKNLSSLTNLINGEIDELTIAPDNSIWFPSKSGIVYKIGDMLNVELKLKLPEPKPNVFGQKKINIDHITFFDSNHVFISGYLGEDLVGKDKTDTDKIFLSNNAGVDWSMITFSKAGEWIYGAIANTDGKSWMGGSRGCIYHSNDFGQNWENISSPFNSNDRVACLFANDSIGVVGALQNGLKITSDNFLTFKNIATPYDKNASMFTSTAGKNGEVRERLYKVKVLDDYLIVDQAHIVFFKRLSENDWHTVSPLLISFDIDFTNKKIIGITAKNEVVELAVNFKDYNIIGNIRNDETLLDLKCQNGTTYFLTATYHPERKNDGVMGSINGLSFVRQGYRRAKTYCFYKVKNGSIVRLELQAQEQSP
ncbi:MAG: hypothetical protein JNL74_13265 [Fibrobacteres bacterium]|nr:hypothetical protein [Fibrobacterota bacterium]